MRLRAKDRTFSEIDSSVKAHTNRWLLWRDLGGRTRPTFGLSDWPIGTYRSWLDELSARLTVRTVDLCGRVRELQEHASDYGQWAFDEQLVSCISTALRLDQSFEQIYASGPQEWLPVPAETPGSQPFALQDHVPPELLSNLESPVRRIWKQEDVGERYDYDFSLKTIEQEPYLPRFDTYPSRPVAVLWNFMRCNRLHLLRVMIDLHLMSNKRTDLGDCNLPTIDDLRCKLSETIHDICASMPCLVGSFCAGLSSSSSRPLTSATSECCSVSAVAALWILHRVCDVPVLSPAVKAWVLDVFDRVGTVGNIRQGTNLKKLYSRNYSTLTTGRVFG